MGRFRQKRLSGKQAPDHIRRYFRQRKRERAERRRQWTRQQRAQWAALQGICQDRRSQARLTRLIHRMTGADPVARESALTELELATLLIRAGFRVELLPEAQDKTADLQCRSGDERMFVEVTALVGSARRAMPRFGADRRKMGGQEAEREPQVLASRILARIAQKARQLAHYQAPVVLAATVPPRDPLEASRFGPREREVDLKLLAGSVTLLLMRLPGLSAVLLSLWDVEPVAFRSGVRLANVSLMERARQHIAYPRVRLLVLNPVAAFSLGTIEIEKLKGML